MLLQKSLALVGRGGNGAKVLAAAGGRRLAGQEAITHATHGL
jgi:hypothetical protein